MKTLRRGLFSLTLLSMAMIMHVERVVAQQGGSMPGNVQVAGRSFYVESIIVVLLIGGALFAVCRSSRRV
jgi:hypothetical protein